MSAHRPGDVLDLLLAHVLEREIELVAHLIAHDAADADAARLRQGFEAGRDVDPVAIDVLVVADDVAEVQPDTKLDAPIRRARSALRSVISRWISTAQRTASTTLTNFFGGRFRNRRYDSQRLRRR